MTLLSVVGRDEPGRRLAELLRRERIVARLHRDRTIDTTVKLRVIGRTQQLLRIDFENQPTDDALLAKLDEFERVVSAHDVVVFSDYGKGGLTHIPRMIATARAAGRRVLVDPKGSEYARYRGAHIITPNRAELREVVGRWADEAELTTKAQALRRDLGLEALLVTRSEEGMSLYGEGSTLNVPTVAREVFDVSGAGDTVIATMAVALAAGASLEEAVRLSNQAAGIVVGKLGTAVVTADELFA